MSCRRHRESCILRRCGESLKLIDRLLEEPAEDASVEIGAIILFIYDLFDSPSMEVLFEDIFRLLSIDLLNI